MQLAKNAAFPSADFYYQHISQSLAPPIQGVYAGTPLLFKFVFQELKGAKAQLLV